MKAISEGALLGRDILYWCGYEPSLKAPVGCCAIRTFQGVVLVDPLPMDEKALKQLEAFGVPSAVLVTNNNHERASREMQARWHVPIFAPDGVQWEVDEKLKDGQKFLGDLSILSLPGAGLGEIALIQEGNLAIFGDILIHIHPGCLELLPERYCEDVQLARKSLVRLQGLDCPVMLFAHGAPIIGDGTLRLKEFLKWCRKGGHGNIIK